MEESIIEAHKNDVIVSMVRIAADYFTQASNEDKKKVARKLLKEMHSH